MLNSVFILTKEGEVLVEKHYAGFQTRLVVETFMTELLKHSNPLDLPPVIATQKNFLFHLRSGELIFLATHRKEVSVLPVIEFLQRLSEVIREYCKEELTENTIRDNFVVIYQLLDETMDGGYPVTTEENLLHELVSGRGIADNFLDQIPDTIGGVELPAALREKLGRTQSQAMKDGTLSPYPHRRLGVSYMSNGIYFDIIEEVSCIVDRNQMLISQEVSGVVSVKCELSGMPTLVVSYRNYGVMDDVSFHPCVDYQRWQQGRVISFVPPDGSFVLQKYRVSAQVPLPLYCKPQINFNDAGGRIFVMVGSKISSRRLDNIVVTIPFSKVVSTVNVTVSQGSFAFDELTKVAIWKVGRISPTQNAAELNGSATLTPGSRAPESNPTVQLEFLLEGVAVSGLAIQECQLQNENYKPYKGMKASTKAGKFQIRC